MTNQVGRPTKLNKELVDKAKAYLFGEYKTVEDVVPNAAGLACYLGIAKSTLYELCNVKNELGEQFSDYCECVQTMQERMLLNGGLSSTYNAQITKLMLTKHGYKEEKESNDDNSKLVDVIADLAKRLPD